MGQKHLEKRYLEAAKYFLINEYFGDYNIKQKIDQIKKIIRNNPAKFLTHQVTWVRKYAAKRFK